MGNEDVLTEETLRNAFEMSRGFVYDTRYILHPNRWEDYKLAFNLTEEQMNKYFVKATYIGE